MAEIRLGIDLGGAAAQLTDGTPAPEGNIANVTGYTTLNRANNAALGAPYYAQANGKEYYLPVILYIPDAEGREQPYYLPHPNVSIAGEVHYVDTPLTDRQGEVSEFICINAYTITMRGIMMNSANELPEAMVIALRNCYVQGIAMKMQCALTDPFLLPIGGKVNIRNLRIDGKPGVKHVCDYSMTLRSDSIFELTDIS